MQRTTRQLRVGFVWILCALFGVVPVYVSADQGPQFTLSSSPAIIITEIQTNGGSASQEFIELYNNTDEDIILDNTTATPAASWKLLFYSATNVKNGISGGTPIWANSVTSGNTVILRGTIPANDYFIISSTGYVPAGVVADQNYGSVGSNLMTDSGGGLQLLQTSGVTGVETLTVHDRIMWLDSATNSPMPAAVLASPTTGKSLQRLPNDDSEYLSAQGTLTDFVPAAGPTPLEAWQPPAPAVLPTDTAGGSDGDTIGQGEDEDADSVSPQTGVDNTGLITPRLTELLPNPASPQTDAADEYIELYNPNDAAFGLAGFSLEIGTSTIRSYDFDDAAVLAAGSYKAYFSAVTRLSLNNSGGQVRLLDATGLIVAETDVYGVAADNQAWTLSLDRWQWTSTPTPGATNILTTVAAKTTAAAKTAAAKKAAAAKTAKTAKTAKAKVAAAKKVKAKKPAKKKLKKPQVAALASSSSEKPKPPIHTGILVAVAGAAVLYGLYEYRNDISNRIHQLRENRAARRHGRSQATWRRGYSSE